jgi:hypothetical protein
VPRLARPLIYARIRRCRRPRPDSGRVESLRMGTLRSLAPYLAVAALLLGAALAVWVLVLS